MRHYDRVDYGQWTYDENPTAGPVIFRKGSEADHLVVGTPETLSDSKGFFQDLDYLALETSERVTVNPRVLDAILDAANRAELIEEDR